MTKTIHPSTVVTNREHQVLRMRATGMSCKEVAGLLNVSDQTVKKLCLDAYRKLGVMGLVEAMNALGWVTVTSHDDYIALQVRTEKAAHAMRVAWITAHRQEVR